MTADGGGRLPPAAGGVSIALATYNGERFLARQLDSLLAQQIAPAEIVATDDCSTDGTVAILEDYAVRAPFPIRIHRNPERLGYRRNFLKAAGLCSAELVFFCDQDDVWMPEKIARLAACFDDPGVMLAYHNAAVVDADERRRRALHTRRNRPPGDPWYYSLGFTLAFRRELMRFTDLWPLSRERGPNEPVAHDEWCFFLGASLGTVAYVDEELVAYRQHGANTYGVSRFPTIRYMIEMWKHDGAMDAWAAAAQQRAALLGAIAARCSNPAPVSALAGRYERLAERYLRRHALYASPSFGKRLAAFAELLRRGDYGAPGGWKVSWQYLPRDLLLGLSGLRNGTAAPQQP